MQQDVLSPLLHNCSESAALIMTASGQEQWRWRYCDLHKQSHWVEQRLRMAGLAKGACLIVQCDDCPQFIAILFACFRLQLALMPLHPTFGSTELEVHFSTIQPALFISDNPQNIHALTNSAIADLPAIWRLLPQTEEWLDTTRQVGQNRESHVSELIISHRHIAGEPPVLLFQSSGSTGKAKTITYTLPRVNTFLAFQKRLFQVFPDKDFQLASATNVLSARVASFPLVHWGGLSFCLQGLLDGRAVVLQKEIDTRNTLALLNAYHCQLLLMVPAMYQELAGYLEQGGSLGVLQYCLVGGEAVPAALEQLLHDRYQLRLYSAYGMSECLTGLAQLPPTQPQTPAGSCGRRLFGDIKLIDASGKVNSNRGEMWVRNETVTPCYTSQALNRQKFIDGWYRTGDILERDQEGNYFYLERSDNMCIHNGRNIFPVELEAVFSGHEEVAACLACAINLRGGERRLAVLVVLVSSSTLSINRLLDYYLTVAPVQTAPVWLMIVDGLPRNSSGKHDRQQGAILLQENYDSHLQQVPAE